MSEQYVMGSPQWLAALHAFFAAARANLVLTRDVSMCEVYRSVPPGISGGSETVAFTVRFSKDSQEVGFELKEANDATFKLSIEYDAVLPLGRTVVDGNPETQAELLRAIGAAVRAGKATIAGTPPPELADSPVHDQIARITA